MDWEQISGEFVLTIVWVTVDDEALDTDDTLGRVFACHVYFRGLYHVSNYVTQRTRLWTRRLNASAVKLELTTGHDPLGIPRLLPPSVSRCGPGEDSGRFPRFICQIRSFKGWHLAVLGRLEGNIMGFR